MLINYCRRGINVIRNLLKKILPVSIANYIHRCILIQNMKAKIRSGEPLKNKHSKIAFEIHVTEHCNLNCKGCDNFSPLAEPEFIDIEEFERDFSRLADIFSHECERIYLIGGEPLLHPEIITLMRIAREKFIKGKIFVFTNGILLSQKDSEFWRACKDNNVDIIISAYPIKIDIDAIRAKAHEFGVNVEWAWGQNENERSTFSIQPLNLKGNSNIKLNFSLCDRANECITLSHGRLFTCTFAPNVHHFNKYFHQNINITEADYVNIYDDVSADEILRKMAEPIPACRYCDLVTPLKTVPWGVSKREISEWA